MNSRVYSYVGDADPNDPQLFGTERVMVTAGGAFPASLRRAGIEAGATPSAFTFIVDTDGLLWIADWPSKHVVCARGGDVLSAGKITINVEDGRVVVSGVTNMSTGYCPEPASWPSVEAALDRAHLTHPSCFTQEYIFRLCENCGQRNVVKEEDYTCAVCSGKLPQEWNFRGCAGKTA